MAAPVVRQFLEAPLASTASLQDRTGADCGVSGAAVCVVEAPCRYGECSKGMMLADLR
jgi:hypothetical protein